MRRISGILSIGQHIAENRDSVKNIMALSRQGRLLTCEDLCIRKLEALFHVNVGSLFLTCTFQSR